MELTGLVPFWDDSIVDTRFTDAVLSVNRPVRVGNVFTTDQMQHASAGFLIPQINGKPLTDAGILIQIIE